MKNVTPKRQRCAIYTRKSTEHNLDLAFNSLDAQREACEAYIKSQAHEGWVLVRDRFDDGGLSGASLDRPALQNLLDRVRARQIDVIVVYKVSIVSPARLPTSPSWWSCSTSTTPQWLWAGGAGALMASAQRHYRSVRRRSPVDLTRG